MKKKAVSQKRVGRPLGANNAETTKARIINAAVQCFAERGYTKASNQQIAKLAGITSGSLYHYFDSKAILYGVALRTVIETVLGAYQSAFDELAETSCVEQLCLGLERVIALSKEQPGIIAFASSAIGEIQKDEELSKTSREDYHQFQGFFRNLMVRAEQRGELAPGVTIESGANVLVACTSGLAFLHASVDNEDDFADAIRAFQDLLRGQFLNPKKKNR